METRSSPEIGLQDTFQNDRSPLLEKRKYKRYSIFLKTEFTDGNSFFSGFTNNISKGGALLATDTHMLPGKNVFIRFYLPNYIDPILVQGEVIWESEHLKSSFNAENKNEIGLGIKIHHIQPKHKVIWENFVDTIAPIFGNKPDVSGPFVQSGKSSSWDAVKKIYKNY